MTARLDDWEMLSAQWRAAPVEDPLPIHTLRRTVRRRQREMKALYAAEIVLTVVVVAFLVKMLRDGVTRSTVTATALVLVWTAIVWGFTSWNRRGTWAPLSESTIAYLRLSRLRIIAGRRTVIFVRASVGVYVVSYGSWFLARVRHSIEDDERAIWVFAAAYCSLMVMWSVWYSRRLTRDYHQLESIERSLALGEAA